MNPRFNQILQLIKGGSNPQQIVMSMLQEQSQSNPFLQNVYNVAQSHNANDMEQIARNMAKSKGVDFDSEFQNFRNFLGF